ncbi:S53 family peptidase [Lentilactobacillus senioris]|uniref:S53 family peptidase n=1 Tax=Lentilactobacillus senioris TaxID=931534 RepID=UPI003D2D9C1A
MKGNLFLALSSAAFLTFSGGQIVSHAASRPEKLRSVLVAFKGKNVSNMDSYINETVTPGNANYRNYLTPREVGQKYGISKDKLDDFRKYFAKYHVKVTTYQGNLALRVTGSNKNLIAAFRAVPSSKKKKNYRTVVRLPKSLQKSVMAVLGLRVSRGKEPKDTKIAGGIQTDVKTTDQNKNLDYLSSNTFAREYGSQKFSDHYKVDQLYNQKLTGKGQRVGLVLTGNFNKSDISHYLEKIGLSGNVDRIHKHYVVDKSNVQKVTNRTNFGMRLEATLDVQQAASVAPGAEVEGYVATSKGYATLPDAMLPMTYAQMLSENQVDQISTSSWVGNEISGLGINGDSETAKQYNAVYNLLFKQAALQGITLFSASGDNGAYDTPMKTPNSPIPTSPYLTIVGGTTLPYSRVINGKLIEVNRERAWGDTYSVSASQKKQGIFSGSAGGFSKLNATPAFQLGVPGVNTFSAIRLLNYKKGKYYINNKPTYFTGKASGRNVPDVSGNADEKTGYATYISYIDKSNKKAKMWMVNGGTSYVAPQMAATTAVMNSGLPKPIGFLNPQMYRLAQGIDSPFTPLNSVKDNNNLFYTGQPNTLYNQATGLGTVNFARLYNQLR